MQGLVRWLVLLSRRGKTAVLADIPGDSVCKLLDYSRSQIEIVTERVGVHHHQKRGAGAGAGRRAKIRVGGRCQDKSHLIAEY